MGCFASKPVEGPAEGGANVAVLAAAPSPSSTANPLSNGAAASKASTENAGQQLEAPVPSPGPSTAGTGGSDGAGKLLPGPRPHRAVLPKAANAKHASLSAVDKVSTARARLYYNLGARIISFRPGFASRAACQLP